MNDYRPLLVWSSSAAPNQRTSSGFDMETVYKRVFFFLVSPTQPDATGTVAVNTSHNDPESRRTEVPPAEPGQKAGFFLNPVGSWHHLDAPKSS